MTVSEEKQKKFIGLLNDEYLEKRILPEISNHIRVTSDDTSSEYIQIAKRVSLPKRFFYEDENYHNGVLANDFARAIWLGERNYLANTLQDWSKDEQIDSLEIESLSLNNLTRACSQVSSPNAILFPLAPSYRDKVFEWTQEGIGYFPEAGKQKLMVSNNELSVYWLPEDVGVETISIIDRSNLTIRQKTKSAAVHPELEQGPNYLESDDEEELMVFFGNLPDVEQTGEDKFDFLVRTIVSKPECINGCAVSLTQSGPLSFDFD